MFLVNFLFLTLLVLCNWLVLLFHHNLFLQPKTQKSNPKIQKDFDGKTLLDTALEFEDQNNIEDNIIYNMKKFQEQFEQDGFVVEINPNIVDLQKGIASKEGKINIVD